jgi:hypothetical protein
MIPAPGQLSLDDELLRLLQQHAPRDRIRERSRSREPAPAPRAPVTDGALRLLRQLVRRGLPAPAVPVAAALVLALDAAAGERS